MADTCTGCGARFAKKDALCDDWRDPARAYGCPHCGMFFHKDMNPTHTHSILAGLFSFGLVFLCSQAAQYFVMQSQWLWAVLSVLPALGLLGVFIWKRLLRRPPLQASGYKRQTGRY